MPVLGAVSSSGAPLDRLGTARRRAAGGVRRRQITCTSVTIDTCACAAPSSRALSAASRSIASPRASASRRRAASTRCWSSDPSARVRLHSARRRVRRLLRPAGRQREWFRSDEAFERADHSPHGLQAQTRADVDRLHPGLRPQLGAAVAEIADPVRERDADGAGLVPRRERLRAIQGRIVAGERPDPPAQTGDEAVLGFVEHVEGVGAEQLVIRRGPLHSRDAPTDQAAQPPCLLQADARRRRPQVGGGRVRRPPVLAPDTGSGSQWSSSSRISVWCPTHASDPAQARGLLVLPVPVSGLRPLGESALLDRGDARPGAGSGPFGARPEGAGRGRRDRLHHRGHRGACARDERDDARPEPAPAQALSAPSPRWRTAPACWAMPRRCPSRTTRSTGTSPRARSSTGRTRSRASPRPTA